MVAWRQVDNNDDTWRWLQTDDVRSLDSGVSELRIFHGPGYRIYFTWRGGSVVILLSGGDKSTQAADINRAKNLVNQLQSEVDDGH